jgi:hypothetical protein
MADYWPSSDDLTLEPKHLVWAFSPKSNHSLLFIVGYENCDPLTFEMHCSYALVLAMFDIHYWGAMLLPHTLHNGHIAIKVLLQQKYLQNLRSSISNAIRSADEAALLNGSWKMEVARYWSIRTWMNISHSPVGRNTYVEQCEAKGIVPYSKLPTTKGEQIRMSYLIFDI